MTTKAPRRVALYLRVSTAKQTTANQRDALEGWAANAGHEVVAVYEDNGISGAKGRDERPGLKALWEGATRREFSMVAAWSLDRLGRSTVDVVSFLEHLESVGVDLYLDQQAMDTSTPMGKAMFTVASAFAEMERSIIRERVKAGIETARNETSAQHTARENRKGRRLKPHGRPATPAAIKKAVLEDRRNGMSLRLTAEKHGIGRATVARIQKETRESA